MATINVDFPRFLLPEVMPKRDTLKYSSTFLRSDRIDTRRCLEEQGVTVLFFQKMNVKSLGLLYTFAYPCCMMFVQQFSLDQMLDRVCF